MKTKYGFDIDKDTFDTTKKYIINQIWKLIPMWENNEDWQKQLEGIIIELTGMSHIFQEQSNYLIILSKLEGLYIITKFSMYRKIVFEVINLVDGLWQD